SKPMLCKLVASCFVLGIVLCASAQDKVTMSSGAVQSGTIVKVDATSVTIHMAAGDIALARKDIAKVEIQKPAEAEAVSKAAETKKYGDAVPVLKAVTDKYMNLPEPWLEQAYAVLGDSLNATGQAAAGADVYKKLLQYFPQSKFGLRSKAGLAQGLLTEKKYDEAIKMLEEATAPMRKELAISQADNYFLGATMVTLGDCYQAKGE